MFCLSRQVRFAINVIPGESPPAMINAYAAAPSHTGLAFYFALTVELQGQLNPQSQYLRDIKEIDEVVRTRAVTALDEMVRDGTFGMGGRAVRRIYSLLEFAFPGTRLRSVTLHLSPALQVHALDSEIPMTRISQKFEFSASHRLHNPALSDEQNRTTFGKCNNALGHGHNYELQVTITGEPDAMGVVIPLHQLEQTVKSTIIDHFDHRNLNVEVEEFKSTIPSVENIARVIFQKLKPRFAGRQKLASVTVWETPKTWCEYSEPA